MNKVVDRFFPVEPPVLKPLALAVMLALRQMQEDAARIADQR